VPIASPLRETAERYFKQVFADINARNISIKDPNQIEKEALIEVRYKLIYSIYNCLF